MLRPEFLRTWPQKETHRVTEWQLGERVEEIPVALDRPNVDGGTITLGYPFGCSSARVLAALLHEMKRRDMEPSVAALCVGGGLGIVALANYMC